MRPKLAALRLEIWAGFRRGPEAPPSTGKVRLSVHDERLRRAHRVAREWTVTEAARMQPITLHAILEAYPQLRPGTLRDHVSLHGIVLLKDTLRGQAYVRYGFSCDWHPSGFAVITHRNRVVAVGGYEVMGHPVPDGTRPTPPPKPLTPAMIARARERAAKAAADNPTHPCGETTVTIPAWAGFRADPYGTPSLGNLLLALSRERGKLEHTATPEQIAGYRFTFEHADEIQDVILRSIVRAYPELRLPFDDAGMDMPASVDVESLRELISITTLTLHQAHAQGVAYVGYSFSCSWDREHGLGVLTHLHRVVKVGGADTAFLDWIADRDRAAHAKS